MKLNVGDYVRTEDGIIDKVIIEYNGKCNSPNCHLKHVSCEHNYYDEESIIKSSPNIIDLIEVDDYVNGKKVTGFNYKGTIYKKEVYCDVRLNGGGTIIPLKDIKSVVTKEQFEQMEYKLED